MYSSALSLTSALDGLGGQRHSPATLPPGKTPYPLYRRLGGPQSLSGKVLKISLPPGFDPLTLDARSGVTRITSVIQCNRHDRTDLRKTIWRLY